MMGGGPLTAGANPFQTQAAEMLPGMFGQAGQYTDLSRQAAMRGMNFNPQQAQQRWMDPYQNQVIGGIQQNFDRQRQQAMMSGSQNAFMQGAGGGSRQAVLQSMMMGDVNRQESQQIGQLLSQGYGQSANLAMQQGNQALQMSNLGFGNMGRGVGLQAQLAGQQFGMGGGLRDIQNAQLQEQMMRQQQGLGMLQGAIGPYGQTTEQIAPPGGISGMLGGAAGGALTGAALGSVFPVIGTTAGAIGGGIGGLFGLF